MKKWKTIIKQTLQNTRLVTLGTLSENIAWSSPMYFSYDKNLNIYVLLDTITQHIKNLTFLSRASVSLETQEKYNIQMIGNIEILGKKDIKDIEKIYNELYQLHTGDLDALNNSRSLDWRLVKIIPSRIFLINTENPEDKQEISFSENTSAHFAN